MHFVFTLPHAQVPSEAMWPMWHPHLGPQPVQVNGWKHFKQLLHAKGKSNELGS